MDWRHLFYRCPSCHNYYLALDSHGNVVGAAAGSPCPHLVSMGTASVTDMSIIRGVVMSQT